MPFVAIALGSNLGDRRAHIVWAIGRLRRLLTNLRASSVIETAPVDVPDEQPPYLNAAVTGNTELSAAALLKKLSSLEAERGRSRPSFRASRTLDLDLILHGDTVVDTEDLAVPHPRFRERAFVLEPLSEIAPNAIDPVSGLTVGELLGKLRTSNF
jgi:2-amino-4-hydroxy-6-hydroxymethyldihydropteridine diphosphokinase